MSNVILTVRIMPEGLEVDLDKLKEKVSEILKDISLGPIAFKKTPIAFGLNSLDLRLLTTEEDGSKIEDLLSNVEGVQSVSILDVSLA